ncbi:ABC transporter ATP-binding protein [Acidipropionibacterium jensenii]|nr:ABC transporter ATP-binding protein [Acidipropionibacterium jensenii]MDN5978447.1 ABC transporter ATP-binding protein [Acidipropionibacterium jensenii]MDN6425672.1 ABC transporter ATP-binding protein [Acidipropionibacterium jensenii]MDN6425675.1 ABC transporter ATP-binding protein [Acidipropionibacterium jensenii]MDN6442925.1 ABC transporter ATP-binding protein [Acidipropionibacterium jensenii]MDN6479452.1 ABC transporter ATP-binding protein [Acidipropionibacterium jensenii]
MKVSGVSAAVGGRTVVSGVTFDVPAGAKLALVGTNGSGKSTLLRALAGINPAVSGSVTLDGRAVQRIKARERARMISFVSQEEVPPAELRLGEMVALGRIPHRPPWAIDTASEERIVVESLTAVGLEKRIGSPCDHLSGGERRRAMIARGLAQECPVLILDEPTNHLDIAWQLRLLDLIGDLQGTVIAAIHDIDSVLRHFDLVAVLHEGRLWAFGDPVEVINHTLMDQAFEVDAQQFMNPTTQQPHLLISRRKDQS